MFCKASPKELGFALGGTPDFLFDTRRGVFSYDALQSRLAGNSFAVDGLADYSGPVIRLNNLTPEELYHLIERLRHVEAGGVVERYLVPDEALLAFMDHCSKRIGDAYFRTPRNTVKAFLDLLAVLEQNPGADWRSRLGVVEIAPDTGATSDPALEVGEDDPDDELTELDLGR